MEISNQLIEQAYKQSGLMHEGISLDAALASPMFKTCLTRIAEAAALPKTMTTHPIKPQWWNQGSMA